MKFTCIRECCRSEAEQRYIHASLEIWNALPEGKRTEGRRLVEQIAESPAEGRALFNVLVRGANPQTEAAHTGVQLRRLYRMRREFYDRFPIV